MGLVNRGIPREIVRELARLARASVFVETGTFQGATARWAANIFEQVHTIELSPHYHAQATAELAELNGVQPHLGDSAEILPRIVAGLSNQRSVFWLDGHWSGGETAGEGNECPLMAELECLVSRQQDIILIDDARLFLCAPPKPHRPDQWPTIADIVRVLDQESQQRFIQVIDDVIFAVPNEPAFRNALVSHAQSPGQPSAKTQRGKRLRLLTKQLLRA